MNIRVNQYWQSKIFWAAVLDSLSLIPVRDVEAIIRYCRELEALRVGAEYNTGTVSEQSMFLYAAIAAMFRPVDVLEVGTFIGKSTMAMAIGARTKLSEVNIHTCDFSNSIEIPTVPGVNLTQYKKATSTEMFGQYALMQRAPGLIHLDGRISKADIDILGRINLNDTVILLDDFEGIEKGVVNALMLNTLLARSHVLIYPKEVGDVQVGAHRFAERSVLACMCPRAHFQFTAQ